MVGPPDVKMGWLDRIVDIHFVGGVGVFIYGYNFTHNAFTEPTVEELDQPFNPTTVMMFKDPKFVTPLSGGKVVPVGSTITQDMLNNLQAWDVPFYHFATSGGSGGTSSFGGQFVAFYNLTQGFKLKAFVPTIPNSTHTVPGVTTWFGWSRTTSTPFSDFANAFLNDPNFRPQDWFGDLFLSQPPKNPIDTYAFGSLASLLFALGGQIAVYEPLSVTGPDTTIPDVATYNWSTSFLSYDSSFTSAPLDAQNHPLWNINAGLVSRSDKSGVLHQGGIGKIVTFTIHDDQTVTGTVD